MCRLIYVSTTSEEDLGAVASEHIRFEPTTAQDDAVVLALLEHPRRWYLTREFGGCSCHFRHCMAIDSHTGERIIDFEPPQPWLPEEPDDVAATVEAYEVFRRIVEEGYSLDIVDVWADARPETVESVAVSVTEVPPDNFRFHDDRRLVLLRNSLRLE